jgi:hypothetical protein
MKDEKENSLRPIGRRLFSSQTVSSINTPNIFKPSHPSYLSAYEDGTECSETSAYKIQTPGNYPEESIEHSEHGESSKSRISHLILFISVFRWCKCCLLLFTVDTSKKCSSSRKRPDLLSGPILPLIQSVPGVPFPRDSSRIVTPSSDEVKNQSSNPPPPPTPAV